MPRGDTEKPMPPLVKIRSSRDQMSAIERRIADFILDNAHLLRDYSSQQLASALGISQSSVVKFSQKLGFKGYPDLKYSIGQAVARASAGAAEQRPAEHDEDDAYTRWTCRCAGQGGGRGGNPADQSARHHRTHRRLIDGAPKVFVCGIGDDGLFAREFAMRLSLLGVLTVHHADPS
jgi:DNA-binding MurR/RpiR family transcriptional regulator